MERISIIDADYMIHVVANHFVVDKKLVEAALGEDPKREDVNQLYATGFNVRSALLRVDSFINDVLQATGATKYVGFVADTASSHTFRHDLAVTKPYKGNRPPTSHQVAYWKPIFTKHMVDTWKFHTVSGVEVDDMCTIYQTTYNKDKNIVPTLCSPDKDLLQVEGLNYDYGKQEFNSIDYNESYRRLFAQSMVGDTTDNIAGLKGVGKKSKLLSFPNCHNFEDCYKFTQKCFFDKGMTPEYFKEQLALVYMLRTPEQYFNNIGEKLKVVEPTPYVSKRDLPKPKIQKAVSKPDFM